MPESRESAAPQGMKPLTETLLIRATFDEFQSWVKNYGLVYEKEWAAMHFNNRYRRDGTITLDYQIHRGNIQGYIRFECKALELKLLRVVATLFSRRRQLAGEELLVLEDNLTLIQSYSSLIMALQSAYAPVENKPQPLASDSLTLREKEVADCLAKGLDDSKIAALLLIEEGTAKKHREHIAKKWEIKQHLELMQREARNRGYGKA